MQICGSSMGHIHMLFFLPCILLYLLNAVFSHKVSGYVISSFEVEESNILTISV